MNVQGVLPAGFKYRLKISTKTGDFLGIIYAPAGDEYCRGKICGSEDLADSTTSVAFLKRRQAEAIKDQNNTLGTLGATGSVHTSGLMSGRTAEPVAPVVPPRRVPLDWVDRGRATVPVPKKRAAGRRTFKCEIEITAQFPAGATASNFCDDLSVALRAIMNGRSATINMSQIEEK